MKNLFLLLLLIATQACAAGKIQNEDVKSEADLIARGSTKAHLINDSKIYLTGNGINDTLQNAINSGTIGSTANGYYGRFTFNHDTACGWFTQNSSYADFPVNTNCTSVTADKNLSAAASIQFPQFKMTNAPAGDYEVRAFLSATCGQNNEQCSLRLIDENNTVLGENTYMAPNNGTTAPRFWIPLEGHVKYTSVGTHTIRIQGFTSAGGSGGLVIEFAQGAGRQLLDFFVDYTK